MIYWTKPTGGYTSNSSGHSAFVTNVSSPFNSINTNSWLPGTGASYHIASDSINVAQVYPYNGNEGVTLGNNNVLSIHCIG